jgi:WD40 repeat protein
MAKLFVSYSRKDSVAARKLITSFKEMEHDVWVDWEDIPPAVDWMEQIFDGIEGADAFIFLVSPDSVTSEVCNVEIGHAAKNNKRIIPIMVRDVDTRKIKVNPTVGDLNWIKGREEDQYEEVLTRVRTAIEQDIEWLEEHSRLQLRALDWHHKKEHSLLLRGSDLRGARKAVTEAEKKDPKPTILLKTYIAHSRRNERRTWTLWGSIAIIAVLMTVLSVYAFQQRDSAIQFAEEARINALAANENRAIAEASEKLARENARKAEIARDQAEIARNEAELARDEEQRQKLIAEARSSAAKAQIYQSRPGELYTSTLLAIDSLQKSPSREAEEILRKNISLLPIPVKQTQLGGRINSLEFNGAGDTFVTASANGSVCAWKVEDGTMFHCWTSPGSVTDATFSPDGKTIVASDVTGVVLILDVESKNIRAKLEFGVPVWDVNVSPNGRTITAARDDGHVSFIGLQTGRESFNLTTFGRLLVSTFSRNGEWIAVGSSAGNVTLWNLGTGKIVDSSGHRGEVLAMEFSPNSRVLVSGGKDNLAFAFDPNTKKQLLRIPNENWVTDIAFSPDSAWFVTVSNDKRIRVWDLKSGEERLRMLQDSFIQEVQVSANGQWIATTGSDRTVRVWNASTGAEMFRIPLNGNGSVLGFDKDGRYLVSGDDSGAISIWDISVMPASTSYVQFNGLIGVAGYNTAGDKVIASDDNRVWVLDPKAFSTLTPRPEGQGKAVRETKGNINHLALSPDSTRIAISTTQNELLLYNIRNRSAVTIKHDNIVTSLSFSADSSKLITGDTDGRLQTWDVVTGDPADTLLEKGSDILSIVTASNFTAVGTRDTISLFDAVGNSAGEIEWLGENRVLAITPDGSLLAMSNESDQVIIWKYAGGKYSLLQTVLREPAASLAFNAKGNMLAIGAANTVYLIDPVTGEEINRIPQANIVTSVSFAGETNTLLTTSANVMQVWDIDSLQKIASDQIVETACSRLIRNFDAAQRFAFFGDENYPPLCEGLPIP